MTCMLSTSVYLKAFTYTEEAVGLVCYGLCKRLLVYQPNGIVSTSKDWEIRNHIPALFLRT